ncbi:bifunctional demethylmenaquinone methyltransferase/2-methoxy-6-polyprenyl-1,4-benzoquinol methylase UbiE [Candidatus Pelagibacter sp. HIMB1321]|uniref:bifunctional demethylmenaquinone methyltransferase/2-methoxy-6-polyprenyl-1,4-benzoquinol methylase UbiE n=1 Tax=Candidatus Pelagibacter sp. HIMB1321 TaxID=1388755 RepID=UPI000A0819D9|nr:bifunctional demethylmenaquinone methyltransferase/2-methoxy-6-polyprenyl-1,4-benzoquinol methylase UbiE [Candidatus Pelagibacter sp. HIMB1321]SMF80276.1 demethylmenaquinone methyltransferase [Candidatus Pelagibacter sp. HIMB1321]
MQQYLQNKKGLVQSVFDKVYDKYDLMNDFMSLGVHRVWKKNLINMMNPSFNSTLIDVACGTGDIGKLFLDNTKSNNLIYCVDPNQSMIAKGKGKLKSYKNIKWVIAPAENIPVQKNCFDFYSISFGLRNTKNINKALAEAHRVLKPGGRFLCLEFSKILNSNLDFFYKNYSKLIPLVGGLVVGEKEPYEYLVKSIENFINQEELIALMEQNGFKKCSYRNLSGGIVSIHSGWKY